MSSNSSLPCASSIADDLATRGYSIRDNFLSESMITLVQQYLIRSEQAGKFHLAGIGNDNQFQVDKTIRSDKVFWLRNQEQETAALADFWQITDQLKATLNRELFLGLQLLEAHYAIYPPGSFYKLHRDQFKNQDTRQVSIVLYLTPEWQPGDGGELWLYPDKQPDPIVVQPKLNTFVCFLSSLLHEVKPTDKKRYSLTGWYLRNEINNPLKLLID